MSAAENITEFDPYNTVFVAPFTIQELEVMDTAEVTRMCISLTRNFDSTRKMQHRLNREWGLPMHPVSHRAQTALQIAVALEYPEGLDDNDAMAGIPSYEVDMWKHIVLHGIQTVNTAIIFTQLFQHCDKNWVLKAMKFAKLQPAAALAA